jgi:hypothetical protein
MQTILQRLHRGLVQLEQHHRIVLALVIGLELAIGVAYCIHLGSTLRYWDEKEYMALAESLVTRHEFVFQGSRAFRPPLYPMFLAGLVGLGAPIVVLRLANFLALGGCMGLLYRIVGAGCGPIGGLAAAAGVLAYPVLSYAAGSLYPQTLAALELLLFLYLLTQARPAPAVYLAAGCLFGLLILTVPTFLPLLFVVLVWLWWQSKPGGLPYVGLLALGASVPVFLWMIRTHAVLGTWIGVSSNSGMNLLLGNSEATTPGSGVTADISRYLDAARGLSETESNRFFTQAALHWISQHPYDATRLYFGKLLHYFAVSEQLGTPGEEGKWRRVLMGVTYVPLMLGGCVRLLLVNRHRLHAAEILFIALYLANAFVNAAFFTRIRFRLPFDFLAIALVGYLVGVVVRGRLHEGRLSAESS